MKLFRILYPITNLGDFDGAPHWKGIRIAGVKAVYLGTITDPATGKKYQRFISQNPGRREVLNHRLDIEATRTGRLGELDSLPGDICTNMVVDETDAEHPHFVAALADAGVWTPVQD